MLSVFRHHFTFKITTFFKEKLKERRKDGLKEEGFTEKRRMD